jgi:BirA family biotin operon repressor/biotin-[acetyl-CoA-carboxylase] ligase
MNIIRLASTTSTMDEALRHPPGTVVVAEEQTAGQGRLGRSWHSERGAGLYLSIVLAVDDTPPVVALALGLAVHEAIQTVTSVSCDLRWPNDVLVGDRKCAGILVQHHGDRVVAGIGVNVNHGEFPADIALTATSLRLAAGRPQDREALFIGILEAIETYTTLLAAEGPDPILRLFTETSSYVRGRRVQVEGVFGWTDGLDPTGFLWLRTDAGARKLIVAGGVRPA